MGVPGCARGELITLYLWRNEPAEAMAELDRIHSWPQSAVLSARALVHAFAGRRSEALAVMRDLEQESRRTYVQPSAFGFVWLALRSVAGELPTFTPLLRGPLAAQASCWQAQA